MSESLQQFIDFLPHSSELKPISGLSQAKRTHVILRSLMTSLKIPRIGGEQVDALSAGWKNPDRSKYNRHGGVCGLVAGSHPEMIFGQRRSERMQVVFKLTRMMNKNFFAGPMPLLTCPVSLVGKVWELLELVVPALFPSDAPMPFSSIVHQLGHSTSHLRLDATPGDRAKSGRPATRPLTTRGR